VERKEWVPLDAVVAEVQRKLAARPDYITLSGSGEPTLFSRIEELIDRIKAITDIPVALLTNGSLLWQEDVRRQVARADLVIPSLDAGGEQSFRLVNRPCDEISFPKMLAGLIAFRRAFRGQYWLEVFVLSAYTMFDEEFSALRRCVERLVSQELVAPERVENVLYYSAARRSETFAPRGP
jgi:wyosine [tRNA(Phe)-imidazoG37] synthetase (radical SAM superfamily)